MGDLSLAPGGESGGLREVQWVGARQVDSETTLKVQVTQDLEAVVVSFNWHRSATNAQAARFAREWAKDRDVTLGILNDMFEVEFSWPR